MSESDITTLDDVAVKQPKKIKIESIKGSNADDAMSGKYEMLTIYSGNEENGSLAVPIGINGYLYQVPRNKPSRVPVEVVNILREAATTTYSRGKDGELIAASRPLHAFSSVPA